MFGYLDGIGQPAVAGFNVNPEPGQQLVLPGVILAGELGDTQIASRPLWAKDGSFLVFRQLQQLVPEFDQFLSDNAPPIVGLTQAESVDLLGARMVGRWKSVSILPSSSLPLLYTLFSPILHPCLVAQENFSSLFIFIGSSC